MSEIPDGVEPAPIPEPIDSALGVVVRPAEGGTWDVLLGLRSRRSRFMPGNLVFPGGKVDPADDPGRDGALARCASREIREESGLTIDPVDFLDAGERTTPPFFAVRFRTRFFVADVPPETRLPDRPPSPEEIESLAFASPEGTLTDWEEGRALVPPPLLPILRTMIALRPRRLEDLATAIASVNAEEDPNPRIEFVPGVWALPLRTRTLPPASCTNAWMPGGKRFVVVDPGSGERGEIARLVANVRKREASGDRVAAVLLTHHHRDHADGAGGTALALGVPVLAHWETLDRLSGLPASVATRSIADGETIDLEGATLRAIHTPGHAPGHLAFLVEPGRALIAGDLVSGLSTILVGFMDGDMDAYIDSLRRAAGVGASIVLPSHGPPLPVKALAAAIAHREERERKVAAALSSEPRALAAIAAEAYVDTPAAPTFLREMQTRGHLMRLARHRRAILDEAGWRRGQVSH
jgi:glyoxylase-like metal-dependent hydrolase (beta-lactamase superfamily II)/8-oxo-dGTP pyrophosphatase MutT (NUDIX family)